MNHKQQQQEEQDTKNTLTIREPLETWTNAETTFGSLPHEIVEWILTFVDDESVPSCRFVCSLWNDSLRNRRVLCGVSELFKRLAFVGRLSVMEWASQHCSPLPLHNPLICAEAAKGGHLHVLKWLRENGCPW